MNLKAEPAAVIAAIAAVVNVLILLFLNDLSSEAQAGIVTAVTLVAGLFIRANVTPVTGP